MAQRFRVEITRFDVDDRLPGYRAVIHVTGPTIGSSDVGVFRFSRVSSTEARYERVCTPQDMVALDDTVPEDGTTQNWRASRVDVIYDNFEDRERFIERVVERLRQLKRGLDAVESADQVSIVEI